jgi:hypothetical protein
MNDFTTPDKIAAYVGGGLIVLGVVGIGLLEIVAGSPHPVTTEGQIEHKALVPLAIRSYIILLGLLTWAGYAVYKVVATTPDTDPA